MKKLYRKGTVHPSPPLVSDHLAFLPATILTLAAALSPADREVLSYLLSCSAVNLSDSRSNNNQKSTKKDDKDHPPSFNCNCFRCYTSYWVRWDTSPNRQLIHEIIDAFEDGLAQSKREKNRRDRKRRGSTNSKASTGLTRHELSSNKDEFGDSDSVEETSSGCGGVDGGEVEVYGGAGHHGDVGDDGFEKGSVRKIVSFIGERFWGVWT